MALDVLEGIHIGRRALRTLTEHILAVGALRQVTAFAVGLGAPRHLHHKGDLLAGHVAQDARVDSGAQVVDVGRVNVLVAFGDECIEHPATPQDAVQLAVTGRAPFELGVGRPVDGGQCVDADLGDTPLHHGARVEVGVAL